MRTRLLKRISLLAAVATLALPATAQATACQGNRWGYVRPELFPTIGNVRATGFPATPKVAPCRVADKIGADIQRLLG